MKIKSVILILFFVFSKDLFAILGLGGNGKKKLPPPKSDQQIIRENQTSCETSGGKWETSWKNKFMHYFCNMPTKDPGRACKFSDECESACVYGRCHSYQVYHGCGVTLRNRDVKNRVCYE